VALWCVIAFAELAYVGREFNAVTSPSLYLRPPALAEALKKLPPGRIFRYRLYDPWWTGMRFGDFPSTRGHALHPEPYATCLDKLPHNANMLWGIPSVSGFSPLQTLALKTLLGQPDNSATVIEFNLTHPIDLLGARYIVTPRQQMPAPLRLVTRVEDISIFENPNALPRAFLVHRTDLASDPAMAVAALQWEGFDYRRTVIVHEAPALLPDLEPVDTAGESAEVVSDTGDLVTVRTAVEQPAYLVLADQDYPGWQAEVDGRKAALARVDYMLKGVRLEPGEHTVRFVFRPASFRIGLWLSLCGVALLGGAAAFVRWRPGGPKAEAERLLDGPYGRRAARLVGLSGAVFLVLGPLLSAELWRDAKAAVTPRVYAATAARVAARYRAGDDDFQAAYGLVRDALLLHPSDPSLRIDVAGHGGRLARELLEQGRLDEARAVAAEVVLLVPQEARAREAILWALSRRKP
jgi:hypothetical protein